MKAFFLTCCISLCFHSCILAQNFTGGLTLGFIASTVNGDNFGGFRQAGLMGGGYVQYPINEYLNFQPEILFEALGSRNDLGTDGLRTNYLSLPLLLNANLNLEANEKKFGLGLEAGPSIGYLLGAIDQRSGRSTTDIYERIDYKLTGGIVFKISEQFRFSVRSTGSVISFLRQGARRNSCFNGFPRFCHYYFSFGLRWQILDR